MSLFQLKSHPVYPQFYDYCENTGVHFFKKATQRVYTDSYFLDEYKNQYKKTYYEDEVNLRTLAKKRLEVLKNFQDPKGKTLLEIGSASGFFLDEAKKVGYITKGIEISKSEVEYSKNSLQLDVKCISFLDFQSDIQFDSIALFFVLEHFKEQEIVLKKIFSLLSSKGILLLTIPSLNGPSFKTNPQEWFETHPTDHFVDYSPKSLKKVLEYFDSEILYMKPMSYHPKRDKGLLGKFPFRFFYKTIADQICYSDTLFMIARRRI
jgi:2-polyprenyl-3-methyl-5-hydroxy-6-metoxy-1,4-benzoquinol methylase